MNWPPGTIFKTALGITVGDQVSTEYDSGPYRVRFINGPVYWQEINDIIIRTWPVVHLACCSLESVEVCAYLGAIRQAENGHWYADGGDEIFVTPDPDHHPQLVDMFDSYPVAEPYQFKDGVDYTRVRGCWHCRRCGDFNAPEQHPRCNVVSCPTCGQSSQLVILMPPRVIGTWQHNAYYYETNYGKVWPGHVTYGQALPEKHNFRKDKPWGPV